MARRDKGDGNPDYLPPESGAKGANKKVMMAIMAVVTAMVMVLLFSMTDDDRPKAEPEKFDVVVETENRPVAPPVEGFGLVVPSEPVKAPAKKEEPITIVVGPPTVDREAEARLREADEIRRRQFARQQEAFSSPIMVKRGVSGASAHAAVESTGQNTRRDKGGHTPVRAGDYDPAAVMDRETFFERADNNQWILPHTREAGRRFELKTGTVIPAVMVGGINSDLPGSIIGQVAQNVYDTATGKHLLVPQGSKLYGLYDSRVIYGQSRVLIAWNRIIFPDGSSVTLGAMPGADISGYAGFEDQVDNHYFRIFGSAVLMSFVSAGMAYAVDKASGSDSDDDGTTMQDEMTSALAAQLGQATLQLLQKNLSISPTLVVRPGYQFNIVVTKDVVFGGPYGAAR